MKNRIVIIHRYRIRLSALLTACWLASAALFTGCTINDPIGDISDPGHQAANVYWDVPSGNIVAGNEVEFTAEYWSTDHTFGYLGVWYDITRNLSYMLTYPGNGFSWSLDSSEVVREFQEIETYTHSESNYVAGKKAYVLQEAFPVSYTLSSIEYKNPFAFNADQFNKLIPESVRMRFRQALFPQLGYTGLQALLVTDNPVVTQARLDGWFEILEAEGVTTKVLKTDSAAVADALLQALPFGAFIYNKNRQYYSVEFSQGFQLKARFRVVNGNQAANFSDVKLITVL